MSETFGSESQQSRQCDRVRLYGERSISFGIGKTLYLRILIKAYYYSGKRITLRVVTLPFTITPAFTVGNRNANSSTIADNIFLSIFIIFTQA